MKGLEMLLKLNDIHDSMFRLGLISEKDKNTIDDLDETIEKELKALELLLPYIYLGRIDEVVVKTQLGDYSIKNKKLYDLLKEILKNE